MNDKYFLKIIKNLNKYFFQDDITIFSVLLSKVLTQY